MTEVALPNAPDGVEWSSTHIQVLDPNLPYEAFEQLVAVAGALGDAGRWLLGDLLLFGSGRYGERYAQALEFGRVGERSLRRYQMVCDRIRSGRRRPGLSFSHHEVVASLVPDDPSRQAHWLKRAEEGKLTTIALDQAIRDALTLAERPPPAARAKQEVLGSTGVVDAVRNLSEAKETLERIGGGLDPETAEAVGVPRAIRAINEAGDTVRRASERLETPSLRDLGRRVVSEATRSSGFAMVPLQVFDEFAAAVAAE